MKRELGLDKLMRMGYQEGIISSFIKEGTEPELA